MRISLIWRSGFALCALGVFLLGSTPAFSQLTVDRTSGALSFGLAESAEVSGYSISSHNGLLNPETWTSLSDQGVEGWMEANPRNQLLTELNPFGFTDPASSPINLGNAYLGTTSGLGAEDVTVQYILSDNSVLDGTVAYSGPINDFVLRIDPASGAANLELLSGNVGPFDISGYSIFSDSGALADGNLTGLGEGWDAASPVPTAIAELNLTGSKMFTTNTTASIGNIFTVGGEQDIRFEYATTDGQRLEGSVAYGAGGGGPDPTSCAAIAAMRIPGDADGDGEVAFLDFLALANNFGTDGGYEGGDFDCDGEVAFLDFLTLANNFGSTGAAAVPEPSTGPLAIFAALLLTGIFRKRVSSTVCLCLIAMTVFMTVGSNSAMALDFNTRIVVLDAANPGANATIDSALEARGILNGTVTNVNIAEDVSGTVDFIDFAGGAGAYSNFDYPYPNGVNDDSQNDFAVQVTGFLEIPEGTWYIGLNSDDGGYITMPRVNFTTTVNENGPTGVAGELMFDGTRGAGTFTYGEFTVPAGGVRTEFEALMFERGGGDAFEVAILDDEFPVEINQDWPDFGIELGDGTYDWKLLETGPASGDFNWDDQVNLEDFLILAANFGTGTTFAQGDDNGDARVDLFDFAALRSSLTPPAAAASVPEPNSLSLLSLASLGLLMARRRRRVQRFVLDSPANNQRSLVNVMKCCSLLFVIMGMILVPITTSYAQTSITTGIDTTLPLGSGLNGPDGPHGAKGSNPDGVERWEWDGSDGGGSNQGLLWFDIPEGLLAGFVETSKATLILNNDNEGDSGDLHRITVNWLELTVDGEDFGGDNITTNSFPDGPGIIPGVNAQEVSNVSTGFMNAAGNPYDFDVSVDVLAWASGEANYGWGFIPTAGNGNGITSFEHETDPHPRLVLEDLFLTNGDFNADGMMDLADFNILLANFNKPATFEQGDFDFSGQVNLDDFIGFRRSFNAPAAAASAVPEPGSMLLFGLALGGISMLRRRR